MLLTMAMLLGSLAPAYAQKVNKGSEPLPAEESGRERPITRQEFAELNLHDKFIIKYKNNNSQVQNNSNNNSKNKNLESKIKYKEQKIKNSLKKSRDISKQKIKNKFKDKNIAQIDAFISNDEPTVVIEQKSNAIVTVTGISLHR